MLNDDELGRILARELRQIGAGLTPSEALNRRVDAIASGPRRSAPRFIRMVAMAASFAAALIAGVAVMSGGSGPQPAFAVTVRPGGHVLVTIRQLAGIKAANAKLRDLGLQVIVAEVRPDCRSGLGMSDLRRTVSTVATVTGPPNRSTVNRHRTGHASTVVLAGGVVGRTGLVLVTADIHPNAGRAICVSPAGAGADKRGSGTPNASSKAVR